MTTPTGHELAQVCDQIEASAQKMRAHTGDWTHQKGDKDVAAAVSRVTKSAAMYQADLFGDMGVGTLPIQGFEDIPKLMLAIADGK
jgi:hypothetical protein